MAKVQAITGNTSDEMVDLESVAREMGATTRYSAGESADALGYMALAGWETGEMVSALPSVLSLATAGQMDLASASDIVTDNMSMFGIEAEDASRASDVFAEAQAKSNTSVGQLSEALKNAGPSASAVGHTIEDTSAILGVFANQGLKGSAAGTALQAMYRDLQAGAENGNIAIGETSVAVYDAEGNMRSMTDIMRDTEEATAGMTQEQRQNALGAVFQQQSLRGTNLYMNEGSASADKLAESLKNSGGAAQTQAEVMDNTLGGSFQRLKSSLEEVALQFFAVIEGPLNSLVGALTRLVGWFGSLSPAMQKTIVAVLAIGASIGPVLIIIGGMAKGVSGLISLWGVLSKAGAFLKIAFTALSGPIGITIAIIASLIAIGIILYKNWDVIKAKGLIIFGALGAFFKAFGASVSSVFSGVWSRITARLVSDWNAIKNFGSQFIQSFKENFNSGLNSIKSFFTNIWSSISTFVSSKIESIRNSAVSKIESMKTGIVRTITNIQMSFSSIWSRIYTTFMGVLSSIFGTSNKYFNNMMSSISSIMNSIYSVVASSLQFIKATFSNVLSFLKGLVTGNFGMMKSAISSQMASIRGIISTIWNAIKNITNSVVSGMVNLVRGLILGMYRGIVSTLNRVKSTFSNIFNSLSRIVGGAFSSVVSAIRSGMARGYAIVTGFVSKFYNAGKNIVGSIADGITSAIGKATDAIGGVVSKVRDFLPFSPAKEGPLQDIDHLNFEGPIVDSLKSAERNVNRAMGNLLTMPNIKSSDVQGKMKKAVSGLESEIVYRDKGESKQKQPAYINLSLGGKNYTGFVENISNQQGQEIDIAEAF